MERIRLYVLVLLMNAAFFSCAKGGIGPETMQEKQLKNVVQQVLYSEKKGQYKIGAQKVSESGEEAVTSLVKNFGSKLQLVSLQAPKEMVKKSMQENYGEYVSKALLAEWINNPQSAPGRLTSSPWPDSIEILSVEKLSEFEYQVKGVIIEITSVEKVSGCIAAKRPVTLRVKKSDSHWVIDAVVLGAYEKDNSAAYKNTQYGFYFPFYTGYE